MAKKTPSEVAAAMQNYTFTEYRHHPHNDPDTFVIRFRVLLVNGETWHPQIITPLTDFAAGFFDQSGNVVAADIWDRCIAEDPPEGDPEGRCFSNDLVSENEKIPPTPQSQEMLDSDKQALDDHGTTPVVFTPAA